MGVNVRAARAARTRTRRIYIASTITSVVILAAVVIFTAVNGGAGSGTATAGTAVDSTQSSIGKSFPAFTLTTPTGSRITKSSLAGHKSLIWFSATSACSSCGPGALQVRQVEQQLGSNAFQVLLVFVNVTGPTSDLTSWRDTYGQSNWAVAVDNQDQLALKVNIPCLDTKFVLDEHGKIIDINSNPVDSSYLTMLRQKVES